MSAGLAPAGMAASFAALARMGSAKSGESIRAGKSRMSRSLSSGARSRDPLAHPGYDAFSVIASSDRG
jgi:hypothetical protein